MKEAKKMLIWFAALLLAAAFAGCGGEIAEKPMKEFSSADGTVSIMLSEDWQAADAGVDGWIGASSRNGRDAVMVIQSVKEENYAGMEDMQAAVKTAYQISELEKLDAVEEVQGLEQLEAYRCKMNMEGVSGNGYIVYGETDYAYYALIYVSARMSDNTMDYVRKVCDSFQEKVPENVSEKVKHSAVETTDTILWMNGTHAVLTMLNGHDYTVFGGRSPDDESVGIEKEMLSRQWGVTDRESADESLDWLLSRGHRTPFAEEMESLTEEGLGDVSKEKRAGFFYENYEMTEEEVQRYIRFYEAYEEKGEEAISAWDYSRMLMLLSGYYVAGYYSEMEALDKSLEIARMIQTKYDSWDTFTDSYMLGYEYWAEESSEFRRLVYEILLEEPDSPYRLPWNMKLVKDW